jgi:hypothetical protein
MTTPAQIVAEARTWIGVPFHHQGYTKVGCDCIGLIAGVGLALGLQGAHEWEFKPEYHQYTRQPDPRLLIRGCDEFLDRVMFAPMLADIIVMKFDVEPMHFALVTGLNPVYVVHALSRLGKVAEHRLDALWGACAFRAYRFRGLEWPN